MKRLMGKEIELRRRMIGGIKAKEIILTRRVQSLFAQAINMLYALITMWLHLTMALILSHFLIKLTFYVENN